MTVCGDVGGGKDRPSWLRVVDRASIVVAVAAQVTMAMTYMLILRDYATNDYFWTHFNVTGTQSFVLDVYNSQHWLPSESAPLGLFTMDMGSLKDYSTPLTSLTIQASRSRYTAWQASDDLHVAIAGMRTQSVSFSVLSLTCFCWVDFERIWETAHTAARQARCHARYRPNGVMYLESMLRNVEWRAWYRIWGSQFDVAFGNTLASSAAGVRWLDRTTTALPLTSITDEAAHWRHYNVTRYLLPWGNSRTLGFDDSVVIRNALQSYLLPLNNVLYQSRGGLWTSVIASFGVWNALGYAIRINASLIRDVPNSFVNSSRTPEDWVGGYPSTPSSILIHNDIGPLASIDLMYVAYPPAFVALHDLLHKSLVRALQTQPSLANLFLNVPLGPPSYSITPPAWRQLNDVWFLGGSPLCYQGSPQKVVQHSFSFDSPCAPPYPTLQVTPTRFNLVFGLVMLHSILDIQQHVDATCAIATGVDVQSACKHSLEAAYKLFIQWPYTSTTQNMSGLVESVAHDVAALNIEFLQFGTTIDGQLKTLHQPLVDARDARWSFYGWLTLLDWVEGRREVVSFEGDAATFVVMSEQDDPSTFKMDPLATPNRFGFAIWVVVWYSVGLITLVMIVAVGGGLLSSTQGSSWRNLLSVNRVVGIVWIGRPLLFVRGFTAMSLLSTAHIELVQTNGFTRFEVTSRSIWQSIVVAGECLWVTYSINDILSLATTTRTHRCGVASAAIVWVAAVALDVIDPIAPTATWSRNCTSTSIQSQMSCVSGEVYIGSYDRFFLLCMLQIAAVVIGWGVLVILDDDKAHRKTAPSLEHRPPSTPCPVIVPAVALYHLDSQVPPRGGGTASSSVYYFDSTTSLLSGFVKFRDVFTQKAYVFSLLLWVYLPIVDRKGTAVQAPHRRTLHSLPSQLPGPPHQLLGHSSMSCKRHQQLKAAVGILFLALSALSSASFFYVSHVKLGNDFMWEGLNSTGLQAFLVDWYNFELLFRPVAANLDPSEARTTALYNGTRTTVSSSALYPQQIQFEGLSLVATVASLQATDPCQLPWVATQLCYVDFQRRWEMASTAIRQRRCHAMVSNAAIFLESILRNTNMEAFVACWGPSVEVGLFHDLRQSTDGKEWIASVMAAPISPDEEVAVWTSQFGIASFTTQWQNYKSLGIVETVAVRNALGALYPLTLKTSSGVYRFELETSRKMYWGWATDLWLVGRNASPTFGACLVRSSSVFLYRNGSVEQALATNQTLAMPLNAGLMLVRARLGPFGSVDMIHVAIPQDVLDLVRQVSVVDMQTMQRNRSSQSPTTRTVRFIYPVPATWLRQNVSTCGGSLLCAPQDMAQDLAGGLLPFFSSSSTCGSVVLEPIEVTRAAFLFALIAWGAVEPCRRENGAACVTVLDACSNISRPFTTCVENFGLIQRWIAMYVRPDNRTALWRQAQRIKASSLAPLEIAIMQFVTRHGGTQDVELWDARLFDAEDPYFQLMAWFFVYEWVVGCREVVTFHGDGGAMTLLSNYISQTTMLANPFEIPSNVAFYCLVCIQYTTGVIFVVTFITIVYSVVGRGRIEGYNMLEVNRVAGIVWVGRPLLCLRSLVAICLLATASVDLEIAGALTQIAPRSNAEFVSTALSSSEMCWLVIVLTDMCMAATKDYTNRYSMRSSVVVTAIATTWRALHPVTPVFQLTRQCTSSQVDFQLECTAGMISIGQVSRVSEMATLTMTVVGLSYVWERWRQPHFKLPRHKVSLLLPAGALYLYHKEPWIFNNTLYLDKASAFMCGLVAVTVSQTTYVLDIKTWRLHTITDDDDMLHGMHGMDPYKRSSMLAAVPMLE
ncbi:hypothetical protein H310_08761 [Aphanomyces invadans]|uniref:Transmembrane protein n=1 Tax=Aphanomyces invadans TaxID=157072 RepID=A0A024TZ54_9STRA|nr:hypothetical protein H310_08761 [Aphanomyces invadans]ETV98647.1 hypothetical protein H310_08761 [Aphanomyces invadans]|eukprot:XP_008872844.1 hypothetical protein H310_08761 [Aphanomyces invadans]